MERVKRYFLKERFLQSSKAFLLLESLLSLLLLSFALVLFLKFLSSPKTLPTLQTHPLIPSGSQRIILRSGELEFEAQKRVCKRGEERLIILEDFR